MSEQTPHQPDRSGNRWETTGEPVDETAAHEPGESPANEAPARTSRFPRARVVGAGVAALVLLVGGVGGFAVGRATAGDDDWDGPGEHQRVGFPTDGDGFHGDRDGGDDDGPGFSDEDDGDDDGSDT
jgi:hypothetical protein